MDNVPCTYRISLKAAIKDKDGRVLLLKEKSDDWELPGGGWSMVKTLKTLWLVRLLKKRAWY
ncbi:MAG TPA: hypothetical protein VGO07_04980 [Candidatus Saccharimonadales bacterium]|jgi:hypothetical protein|nr:hypothetical protein [Candidatus Saccharimonadales bacterium]